MLSYKNSEINYAEHFVGQGAIKLKPRVDTSHSLSSTISSLNFCSNEKVYIFRDYLIAKSSKKLINEQ